MPPASNITNRFPSLLEYLDALGHGYLIKVKLKNPAQLLAQQHSRPIRNQSGWEQCEFQYQANGWSCPRFFVAVRQHKEPLNDHPQEELLELEHDEYFCYVTTEHLSAWQAHRQYGERATSEIWIEESKSQIGMAHLKTDDFLASAALFQTAILAYNTLRWMALMSGKEQLRQWEPQSIRAFLTRVVGKLLTGANQLCIKLPREHHYSRHWNDWIAFFGSLAFFPAPLADNKPLREGDGVIRLMMLPNLRMTKKAVAEVPFWD